MFGFKRKQKLSKISELDFLKSYYSRPLRNLKEHEIVDGQIIKQGKFLKLNQQQFQHLKQVKHLKKLLKNNPNC